MTNIDQTDDSAQADDNLSGSHPDENAELIDLGEDDDGDPEDEESPDDEGNPVVQGPVAHVSSLDRQMTFPAGTTRREAIAQFDAESDMGADLVYRVQNVGEIDPSTLDEPLGENDVITVYTRRVAKGGIEGGQRSAS